MKKVLLSVLVLLLLLGAYLAFYPVPIDPLAWNDVPEAPALEGHYAQNSDLNALSVLFKGQCHACEDIAIDTLGRIYGGTEEGEIMRFENAESEGEVFAKTGGRPLGLHFDKNQNLIVADADKGLLSISPEGKVSVLTDGYGGYKFKFADDLEIAEDGTIYFSDASNKFGVKKYNFDLMEHRGNGALYAYHPSRGETELLLDGLHFANGIAVAEDQSFVLVNETGKYWVRKYFLTGEKKGQSEILIDNLPGFPDGISKGTNGIYWIALASPRDSGLDQLLPSPSMRKVILRLPESFQPAPIYYGFVLGIDANGNVKYNLQDPDAKFGVNTSVQEHEGNLYIGSLKENGVGRIARPE